MQLCYLRNFLLILLPLAVWGQQYHRSLDSEKWEFKSQSSDKNNWLPAKVPGTVHTDLFRNKVISDPFLGANEKQLQWIENEDWLYRTTFVITKSEIEHDSCTLQFNGLDTYAEVYLNGIKILSANNMFRTWNVDVKRLLKLGNNKLEITFYSAVKKGKLDAEKLRYTLPGDEKIFTRKAQYQYGWDWGPRFVTAGIWKNLSLNFWSKATIVDVHYNQKALSKAKAELEFVATVCSKVDGKFNLSINHITKEFLLKKGTNRLEVKYNISKPKLWWPNGLGEAYLYPCLISLTMGNQITDSKKISIGLRTIELVQTTDTNGKSFYFKVNDVPVFMKGANYIPADSFLPEATDSIYNTIVKNAAAAHMNMLRVWGGGVYGEDAFYEACDKNGILIWQDFMFACAMYPGDADFVTNVTAEVDDNVNRLKNHPSLALWCGNNEVDEGWHNWGWQKQYQYTAADSAKIWHDYTHLFHDVIPQTLSRLLPSNENRYWASSPSIGWGRKESLQQGDSHYWGVWWGMEPFKMYESKVGRFMSEYGFQGMPDWKTVLSFGNQEELNFDSEVVKNHQKHPTGYKTIDEYMARDYKVPASLEDYCYVSQLLQAVGMKTAIESHRRAKPFCMGTLFWQLNDCWPVTSWSSVDYFGRWKAGMYQVKKSYAEVLVSIKEEDDRYDVYIVNDAVEKKEGELVVNLFDFDGKLLRNTILKKSIGENSSLVQYSLSKKEIEPHDYRKTVLAATFSSNATSSNTNFYFVKPKDLLLTKPTIQIKRLDRVTIEVTSDVLAKNVYLSSSEDCFFSENYFDVLAGEKVIITLSKPILDIKVKSLFDTF